MKYYNEYECEIVRNSLKYNKFTESSDSNYDYRKFERCFSGRMTKRRWQILNSYCRRNSYRIHIASDYDCTGSLCGHYMELSYSCNQVVIKLAMSYDY
jgi:hypothetical protein